jgi:hypothetical protein
MLDPVKHPILAHKHNVLIHITSRQNPALTAAALQQIHRLHHTQAARIIVDLERHVQCSQLCVDEPLLLFTGVLNNVDGVKHGYHLLIVELFQLLQRMRQFSGEGWQV